MSRSIWHGLATVCLIAGFSLGVAPLVQWFGFDHANGIIATVFGATAAPAVWVVPAVILVAAIVGLFGCGHRGDKVRGA